MFEIITKEKVYFGSLAILTSLEVATKGHNNYLIQEENGKRTWIPKEKVIEVKYL